MHKTGLVASREFSHRIRQRGFWLMSAGFPLILIVVWIAAGVLASRPASEPGPADPPADVVGYVDQAGLIQTQPDSIPAGLFRAMPSVRAAEAALARGDVGAYFIIPTDYRETGDVQRVSQHLSLTAADVRWFNRLLQVNLLPDAGPDQIDRLRRPFYAPGPEFVKTTPAGQPAAPVNQLVPLLVSLVILVPLFTSASYLFESMSQEKSSRVIEILLVSLRPHHLLAGKILGFGALTVVQYSLWAIFGLLALLVTGQETGRLLAGAGLVPGQLAWLVPFALGGFLLYAALMAGIGAQARDVEDGRSWLFVISIPLMMPLYLWMFIGRNPNSLVAVALSLIPFSSPVAMLMRLTMTAVPTWQLVTSLVLLFLTALGTIWLMARLFRVRTLLSGESISLRRMWTTLTGSNTI